jgi:hypothetical protein
MINRLLLTLIQGQFSNGPVWDWSLKLLGLMIVAVLLIVISPFLGKLLPRRTSASSAPFPEWAPDKPFESLKAIFAATLKEGESALNWYRDNIRGKRLSSRLIRLFAIFLASVGALVPLIVAAARTHDRSQDIFDPQWGYFSFATAAVLLAVDKFYGFSTGWVRYLKTQLVLERALSDLRYDWIVQIAKIENQTPTLEQTQVILQKLKDYVDFVHTQVHQETEAWILEFQAGLSDLMASVKAQSDATRPGSIQVTVSNANHFESISVLLDQTTEQVVQGSQCLFQSVAPGVHAVLLRGKKDSKVHVASDVVRVGSGAITTLSLAIPDS